MEILIIKLGAKGDVVRTLPILPALKRKYPKSKIYWVTKPNISDLIERNPSIEKVITFPCVIKDKFDLLYNFDIEKEATKLAAIIEADKKYGFYSEGEYPTAFNLEAGYYLNTVFDDNLKKTNKKTYQQVIFEIAGLEFKGEHETIYLNDDSRSYASTFVKENQLNNKKILGIHMGAGPRWPSKAWSESKIKELIRKAQNNNYEIILFGGPDEIEKHAKLAQELDNSGIKVYQNNPNNTNKEFASLINLCDRIVCSDSFALHVAVALKKPVVALFFCTSPAEIESYGIVKKIISPFLYEFFPEKMNEYNEKLVNSISVDEVFKALNSF